MPCHCIAPVPASASNAEQPPNNNAVHRKSVIAIRSADEKRYLPCPSCPPAVVCPPPSPPCATTSTGLASSSTSSIGPNNRTAGGALASTSLCWRMPGGVFNVVHHIVNLGAKRQTLCYDVVNNNIFAPFYNVHTWLTRGLIKYLITNSNQTRYWMEVGSFRGGSAVRTAQVARELGYQPGQYAVHAIDSWTGDVDMWHHLHDWLDVRQGKPHILEQFIHSVVVHDAQEYVVPQQVTSIVGLRSMIRHVLQTPGAIAPDIIYLDSAHEIGETELEVIAAYQLVRLGGFLAGDDFVSGWWGVIHDVVKFAASLPCARPDNATRAECQTPWPDGEEQPIPLPASVWTVLHAPKEIEKVLRLYSPASWVIRKITAAPKTGGKA